MARRVVHISELEAVGHFADLLARLPAGEEIVIEDDIRPLAVIQPVEPFVRLLSESLKLARKHGSITTPDEGFARDVEAGIESRRKHS